MQVEDVAIKRTDKKPREVSVGRDSYEILCR